MWTFQALRYILKSVNMAQAGSGLLAPHNGDPISLNHQCSNRDCLQSHEKLVKLFLDWLRLQNSLSIYLVYYLYINVYRARPTNLFPYKQALKSKYRFRSLKYFELRTTRSILEHSSLLICICDQWLYDQWYICRYVDVPFDCLRNKNIALLV